MKDNQAAHHRKAWNDQHTLLRRLLGKAEDFSKAIEVFLDHHAQVHTARLRADGHGSFQDEVLQGLTDAQMRYIPPKRPHSVVWLLWHITRIEDATLNVLLADKPQVFYRGNWQRKLHSPYVDVGNELSMADIHALSEAVDVKALLAYRLAVGRRTRQIAAQLTPDMLKVKPSPDRLQCLVEDGTVPAQARWLLNYWGGHPQTNLLLMPATRHSFVHFNEIERMLPVVRQLQVT